MADQSQALVQSNGAAMTNMFLDPALFAHLQRVGKMFAASGLVPEHLRRDEAGCMIAFAIAQQLGENPIVVMQNIHNIKGKAGWSAQYMIARANASGVFRDSIDWDVSGSGDSLSVTAYAHKATTGKRVHATVDMAMAKAEGWTSNPKYKSMPEIMLRYRSATFLVRFNCPEVMMGYSTADEIEDMAAAESFPVRGPVDLTAAVEAAESATVEIGPEAPAVDEAGNPVPDPEPEPKRTRRSQPYDGSLL